MYKEKSPDRQRIKTHFPVLIVVNLIILIFILFSFELVLRILKIGYGSAPLSSDSLLHHRHPRNYTFLCFSSSGEFGNFLVHYDDAGMISNPFAINKKDTANSKIRIALMGDSCIEAIQVPYSDSAGGILEKCAGDGTVIKNYGTSSYSPILYYLQWKYEVAKFKPTHVFLLLHYNDIRDDYELSKKAIYSSTNDLIAVPGPHRYWLAEWGRKSYALRYFNKFFKIIVLNLKYLNSQKILKDSRGFIEENPDIPQLSSDYILNLEMAIAQSGGKLILMAVPSKYRLQVAADKQDNPIIEFSDKWKIWAHDHGIAFIDLVEAFHQEYKTTGKKLFFDKDVHFNSEGNRTLAKTIAQAFPEIFSLSEDMLSAKGKSTE